MSIAWFAIGEAPAGAQPAAKSRSGKPPRNRLVTAKADEIQLPEAR